MPSAELGKARRLSDASGRYIEFCKSTIDNAIDLKGMRIFVDCANGAAYHVAPMFSRAWRRRLRDGSTARWLQHQRWGSATHTEHLSDWTAAAGCDVGISLDGDADRLIMADACGRVYNGDELLYVMARDRMAVGGKVEGVVGTLMTNYALESGWASLAWA